MPKRRKKLTARVVALNGDAEYITPDALCRRWGGAVTVGTLRNWRCQKRGPPWTKLERAVVYPLNGVIEWERQNTVRESN